MAEGGWGWRVDKENAETQQIQKKWQKARQGGENIMYQKYDAAYVSKF